MRTSLLLIFLAAFVHANAVTVSISVNAAPACSAGSGSLIANGNGGVGPYSYLWTPGGETTVQIDNLIPGTYSVTLTDYNGDQATDQIELMAEPYALTTSSMYYAGFCNDLVKVGIFPANYGPNIGPPPYYMDGEQMTVTDIGSGQMVYYGEFMASPDYYGQFPLLSFEDGNGCTGTIAAYCGWPLEWPVVTVLDVQGSCSGGNNGSVTYSVGVEGHQQQLTAYVTGGAPGSGSSELGAYEATLTTANLAPGDHWIILSGGYSITQSGFGCADSTLVNIPDNGTSCGSVSGKVFMDYNVDCAYQTGESGIPHAMLEILPGPYYALASSSGDYAINLPLGNYTVEHLSAILDEHCIGTPIPVAVTGNITGIDIADTSLIALDARITGANDPARPGFEFLMVLNARNLTPAVTGNISMVLTIDPALTFVSSMPAGTVVGNTITWDLDSLSAFQWRSVDVYLQVAPDIGLLGTTLNNTATLTTANNDVDLSNNTVSLPVLVTGAYDPNDKVAATSSRASDELYYLDVDNWIDYTIRFQNTGTDTAFTVVVTDTLAQELDMATFQPILGSHPYTVSFKPGRAVEWRFENIQLPDSNVNEPKSHGLLSFRIRPVQPTLPGTVIENIANIYFDFNEPVITEPSVLTAEFSTGIEESDATSITITPNPADDRIAIRSTEPLGHVEIWGADGRLLLTRTMNGTFLQIPVGPFAPGMYVVRTVTATGKLHRQRFIKL